MTSGKFRRSPHLQLSEALGMSNGSTSDDRGEIVHGITIQLVRKARKGASALSILLVFLLAACGPSTSSMSPATAKRDISHAYGTLFNFANKSVSAKTAEIQNGSTLKEALSQALTSSLAEEATGARVDSVQLLGSTSCSEDLLPYPCAEVTYDILGVGGKPLFTTPSSGYAVYLNGEWLVAKSTICGLLELFYSASGRSGYPPGC